MADELDLTPWTSYPTGNAEDWVERYAPLVREDRVLREVEGAAVSVLVVAWNTPDDVVLALDAIRASAARCAAPVEVLLVDNGGLTAAQPAIDERVDRVVHMVGNVRLCRARNLLAALATGEVLVFLDDDGLIEVEHLAAVERWFEDPSLTAIRGKVTHREHRYFTTLADHYDLGAAAHPDLLVTEGNMAIRRAAYLEAGGFNETLAGNEGVDLCFRLRQRDPEARTLYVPDVVLRHDFVDSWAKFRRKFSHYAQMDDQLARLDPGLGPFLEEYFAGSRPKRSYTLDEKVARWGLTKLKKRLQRRARKVARAR